MALTGFDPTIVNTSVSGVVSAYNNLCTALNTEMQSKFFEGMADKWACKYAQDFFSNAKTKIDALINAANITFQSIVDSMNSAGSAWANDTGASFSPMSFTTNASTIDSSCIQENIAGVRGIDLQSADSTATSSLGTVVSNSDSALSEAKSAVASCGFIGGSQQQNLTTSLNTIQTNIHSVMDDLSTSFKADISQTVTQYGDTEGKVSSAFSGSN